MGGCTVNLVTHCNTMWRPSGKLGKIGNLMTYVYGPKVFKYFRQRDENGAGPFHLRFKGPLLYFIGDFCKENEHEHVFFSLFFRLFVILSKCFM